MHLAAELGKQDRMPAINVEATRRLAEAAERHGIKAFCYMSTVSVYGSGRTRTMTETAPVLTSSVDVKSEYWALDYVRAYGRTKLAGEEAILRVAATLPYVILRPTVVVDLHNLIGLRDWGLSKRLFAAHRPSHHVYVRDVTDAAIWTMTQSLSGAWPAGQVQIFNLSDHEDARCADRRLHATGVRDQPRSPLPGHPDARRRRLAPRFPTQPDAALAQSSLAHALPQRSPAAGRVSTPLRHGRSPHQGAGGPASGNTGANRGLKAVSTVSIGVPSGTGTPQIMVSR
jgi:nucleoside-diphosphate-sugar epimerase